MRARPWWLLTLLALQLSCAVGGEVPSPVVPPDPHEGEGVVGESVRSGGWDRTYQMFVPAGHDGHTPLPLVFVLHGARGSGASIRNALAMDEAAQRRGYVAIYPDGLASWANGLGTLADAVAVDDVKFIRTLLGQVSSAVPIDRRRVYAVGFSDGGSMCYRLGCQLMDELAAVGALSSGIPSVEKLYGRPTRPMPLFMLAGTADEIFSLKSIRETAQAWASLDGCRTHSSETLYELSAEGRPIERTVYSRCSNDVSVHLYLVEGGRHTTGFRLKETTVADMVLDFFARYERP
jgi:polyhydroxybutyrate depolymerase